MRKEEDTKQKIARGELSLDFYHLREVLQSEKVNYYETEEELQHRKV